MDNPKGLLASNPIHICHNHHLMITFHNSKYFQNFKNYFQPFFTASWKVVVGFTLNFHVFDSFATVVVNSELSYKVIMDKLSRQEIHGQKVQVMNCTPSTHKQLDSSARKDSMPASNGKCFFKILNLN